MDADADPDAAGCQGRNKLERASCRPGWPIEQRENAVAGVICTDSAGSGQRGIDDPVVCVELMSPVRITSRAQLLCRADDVGEQNRLEDTLVAKTAGLVADEFQRLCRQRVEDVEPVVHAWGEFEKPRPGNPGSERLRGFDGHKSIPWTCEYERRYPD